MYEVVPEAYSSVSRVSGKLRDKLSLTLPGTKVSSLTDGVQHVASLKELLLVDEFKNCVPDRIVTYLNEQKVSA